VSADQPQRVCWQGDQDIAESTFLPKVAKFRHGHCITGQEILVASLVFVVLRLGFATGAFQ